jgi:molybdate transport repressor ModE-like protein
MSCVRWNHCITTASNQSTSLIRYLVSFLTMELRHLQALTAISDHGTFSAAADHLGTVQSNISAHVARLEKELGAPLIDRADGRLTEEGTVVVARARRILSELDALLSDVAACKDEVTGTVRVGMIGTTARWLVPRLMDAVAQRHPKLRLIIVEGTTTGLEPQLANGQLDVAVLHLPVSGRDLVTRLLFEEDLMLVVPEGHALASADRPLNLDDLADLELLLPLPGTSYRDELDAVTRPLGITLLPAAEIDGLRLIASLTFEGYGPAILPATAIPTILQDRFRPVPISGLPRRRVGVAQRSRGLPSAPTRALIELLRTTVAQPVGQPRGLHLTA